MLTVLLDIHLCKFLVIFILPDLLIPFSLHQPTCCSSYFISLSLNLRVFLSFPFYFPSTTSVSSIYLHLPTPISISLTSGCFRCVCQTKVCGSHLGEGVLITLRGSGADYTSAAHSPQRGCDGNQRLVQKRTMISEIQIPSSS